MPMIPNSGGEGEMSFGDREPIKFKYSHLSIEPAFDTANWLASNQRHCDALRAAGVLIRAARDPDNERFVVYVAHRDTEVHRVRTDDPLAALRHLLAAFGVTEAE